MESKSLRSLWPYLSAFVVGLALIYTFAYWYTVGVNAFQFMSLGELILATSYPLIIIAISLGLGIGTALPLSKLLISVRPRIFGRSEQPPSKLYTLGSEIVLGIILPATSVVA